MSTTLAQARRRPASAPAQSSRSRPAAEFVLSWLTRLSYYPLSSLLMCKTIGLRGLGATCVRKDASKGTLTHLCCACSFRFSVRGAGLQ
ncbi:hypothetical protein AGR1C_Cc50341 [Agrobacterium fabacearum TT111]|nr:hypothetical protein AGR1C_Cc50341 [Agrobacterium fabacearum TT111]